MTTTVVLERPYRSLGLVYVPVDLRLGKVLLRGSQPIEPVYDKALAALEAKAHKMGADAIIGLRNDATNSAADFNVLMGTAVKFEPAPTREQVTQHFPA